MRDLDKKEVEGNTSEDQKRQLVELKNDLDVVRIQEEKCWRQKTKLKWVKDEDANTSLFHWMVN